MGFPVMPKLGNSQSHTFPSRSQNKRFIQLVMEHKMRGCGGKGGFDIHRTEVSKYTPFLLGAQPHLEGKCIGGS